MASKSSKRRKIQDDDSSSQGSTCVIYEILTGGTLKEVAKYLAPPSRILFATAITPPSSPYDMMMSRFRPRIGRSSIAGDEWHTLNFGDVEKELAAKLSDEDIRKVILHIDAANKVKRLFLTNCTNITGSCLSPLMGCTSIEQIDLSLVGEHKIPQLNPAPPLSSDQVLPILQSIISQESNSLKHLQFPHSWRAKCSSSWRDKDDGDFRFIDFLKQYDIITQNRVMACCGARLDRGLISFDEDWSFGSQYHTCSNCTKYYCYKCTDQDGNRLLHFCQTCERGYCIACEAMVECSAYNCREFLCVDCAPHYSCPNITCTDILCKECRTDCNECKRSWCDGCMDCLLCSECGIGCCKECSEKEEGVNGVYWCEDCSDSWCDNCRVKRCQSGENDYCGECVGIISPILLEANKKMQAQINSLGDENKKMQDENNELRGEIKRLKSANEPSLWYEDM